MRAVFRARQSHVGNRTRNAAVTVIKRMDGDEPEMGQSCFKDRINACLAIEPFQEHTHISMEASRRRRLEMDTLFSDRAGDNLHGASAVVTPAPCPDFSHATASGRKQGGMPCSEPFCGECLVIVVCGV